MGGGVELNHRNDREFRAPASNSMKSPESNLPGHDRRAVASFKIRRWIFAARSDPPGWPAGQFCPTFDLRALATTVFGDHGVTIAKLPTNPGSGRSPVE